MITPEIAESIEHSVLCWLATVSADGFPNVSPKEAFIHDGGGRILIANIASPKTARNIYENEKVCASFVNVFIQKGFKITGIGKILKPGISGYEDRFEKLTSVIGTRFPIVSIFEIEPSKVEEIIAPSYRLFPDSSPEDRIKESVASYRIEHYKKQAEQSSRGNVG